VTLGELASIKHIGAKRALSMPVMLPSLADQERIAGGLDAMDEAIAATRVEAARLRKVRAILLSGLLDRSITIAHAELEV